ncbi:hypothetical protein RJT34_08969 [Clitoria ternatea]|uniref:FMR1-interacting protein 1 conserved domain-containing protein n=1 Tax=Clitoria ternatea TaxID=43366 RepID=A0AAN9PUD9_CLITE
MSSNNNPSKTEPTFLNAPNNNNNNNHFYLQNNGVGNHQGQNLMPPFMQPPMNTAPFMNGAGNQHFLPLQNNQLHLPHMGLAGPQQGQSHVGGLGPQNGVGNANFNPMIPVQGQFNVSQLQVQGQILAQSILNMLQQQPNVNMNMNVPNGQFCAQYPMQNMNQQLSMQISNPSQVVPYGTQMQPGSCPMFGFPNQVPQAMVPQNSMFSANPQLGIVPGNQVGPQIAPNERNPALPTASSNAFVSSTPFSSQQVQGNTSGSLNSNSGHTNNSQPSSFSKSRLQENPSSNVKTNVPNSNWKGSPSNNFKNKPNRGGFQGGFQKHKFHDNNNGKRRSGFPKEYQGKGPTTWRAGQDVLKSKEPKQEPEKSFSVTYTEQEIQQWREARRKNHPSNSNTRKHREQPEDSKVIDREVLQRELKAVLAKQAELGVEVAEIPSSYLKNSENQGVQNEGKNKYGENRKSRKRFNKKSDRRGRFGKKQKFTDKEFSESPSLKKRRPTLLQKLLSADIKRDKSYLLQVFRFMVINSFFKDYPDKPLRYPSLVIKENGIEGDGEETCLHTQKDVIKHENKKAVQKIVNNGNGHDSEDEDSDDNDDDNENESIINDNPHKEPSSLAKRHCDSEEGIEESDEEEGEIIE